MGPNPGAFSERMIAPASGQSKESFAGAFSALFLSAFVPLQDDDLERIFRPFERAETSGEPGFGLGLAIVKKIMEAHRGTVRAQNTEQGFTIKMKLSPNP